MKHQAVLSLPVAACLVVLGPNLAQAKSAAHAQDAQGSMTAASSNAGSREAMRMVPAEADLVKTLDARNLHAGQQFQAKLADTVYLKNGPELRKGTELVGTVVTDKMSSDGQPSTLALRFTEAELKNGKAVPIKATIVGIYPPSSGDFYGSSQSQAPNYWTDKTLQVDQIGAMAGVDLHSRIAARDSAVFVSRKKDNIKFGGGSEFAIAIAARNTAG